MASTEDRANKQLPKAFIETYQIFKKATGIPKETQFVLSTSLHNAYTNSKQVCFGPEWVDSAIPENFHGFGEDVATVQSMNQMNCWFWFLSGFGCGPSFDGEAKRSSLAVLVL